MIEEIVSKSRREDEPDRSCGCECYCYPETKNSSLKTQKDKAYEVGNCCGCYCEFEASKTVKLIGYEKASKTSEVTEEVLNGLEEQIEEKRDTER